MIFASHVALLQLRQDNIFGAASSAADPSGRIGRDVLQ